ncbi:MULTISPECIES: hypothetical protein [Halobacterium]|uniref:hypothetical protein n=1 Tax=Halobacterium TaxID=2239 RepID=UPI00073E68A9|nr:MULTISPECIES: hypothetical protein [Halobacterium]MCG1003809.1 hypothetical protein [Halobacterium noricense]
MPSVRSVARALLAVVGVALVTLGVAIGVPALGQDGFPVGLALGLAVLSFAAGGAERGAAALLSGRGLRPAQRAVLKLAGVLAVLAFVLPATGLFVAPELLYDQFGVDALVAAILGWLYLSTGALAVAVLVALWRAAELAYAAVAY